MCSCSAGPARRCLVYVPGGWTTKATTRSPHTTIGYADDRDVDDVRMAEQHLLDLGRVHVGTAGDDHVLEPIGHVQVALVVDLAQVAGVQPSAAKRLLASRWVVANSRTSPTARERRPRRSRRDPFDVVFVDDPELDARSHASGAAQQAGAMLLPPEHGRRHRRLALRVELHEHVAECTRALARAPTPGRVLPRRRRTADQERRRSAPLKEVGQHDDLRRNEPRVRHPPRTHRRRGSSRARTAGCR